MTLSEFITSNKLRPADAVIARKKAISLFDHYLIYLGVNDYRHNFIVRDPKGVRILSYEELNEYIGDFHPSRIKRFLGNEVQRKAAVSRALNRMDEISYNLLYDNCEHLANYVQSGKEFSQQTKVAGLGLTALGIATTASAKNDLVRGIGILTAIFGLFTALSEDEE